MGSRAVVIVCRDDDAARARFGVADGETGVVLHAHRPAASSTTRRSRAALLARVRAAVDARRPLGRARDRLGLPRLRADAVVGEGAGAAARAVRRRRRRRRARRSPPAIAALDAGGGARRRRRRRCSTALARRGCERVERYVDAYRALLLAGRRRSPTCSSRRSTCSPARARVHVDQRPRLAHGARSAGSCAADAGAAHARRRTAPSTSTDAAQRRGRRSPGGSELTGARRRGHGRQAARLRRPRPARPRRSRP